MMEKILVILIVISAVVALVLKTRNTFKNGECSCGDSCEGCSACKPLEIQTIDISQEQNHVKGEDEHE